MQDGVQTAQASKFVYQLWRPVHAIQRADEDMNPADRCRPDLDAAANYAAVSVLCRQHGLHRRERGARRWRCTSAPNDIPFTVHVDRPQRQRECGAALRGFWQMAEHQAVSREYGGIHYHFDTTASQEVCPKVAGYIFAQLHATEARLIPSALTSGRGSRPALFLFFSRCCSCAGR